MNILRDCLIWVCDEQHYGEICLRGDYRRKCILLWGGGDRCNWVLTVKFFCVVCCYNLNYIEVHLLISQVSICPSPTTNDYTMGVTIDNAPALSL